MANNKQDQPRIAGLVFHSTRCAINYADLILSAIKKVDSSKVWMKTDRVSTIVRGRIPHIFDVIGCIS